MALRRYRGGTNALGKAFYKGGFESKMNRREAALILETPYVQLDAWKMAKCKRMMEMLTGCLRQ